MYIYIYCEVQSMVFQIKYNYRPKEPFGNNQIDNLEKACVK